jgi:threonine/homoserine/homoserine lactone efflux protein
MLPIWAFVGVTVPLVLAPGSSTTVVLRNSIAGGVRAGLMTAVGTNTGSLCYGLLTAFGFALALRHWPSVWTLLRVGGVTYLTWLGVRSLQRAWTVRGTTAAPDSAPVRGGPWRHAYEGFVTNVLNPSLATFYVILLPQFVPPGAPVVRSVLLLTAIHVSLAATWHCTWAAAGATLARTLSGGRPRQALEAVAGVALLWLSARLAFT